MVQVEVDAAAPDVVAQEWLASLLTAAARRRRDRDPRPDQAVRPHGGRRRPVASTSTPAGSPASSARTGRARARRCAACSGSTGPSAARRTFDGRRFDVDLRRPLLRGRRAARRRLRPPRSLRSQPPALAGGERTGCRASRVDEVLATRRPDRGRRAQGRAATRSACASASGWPACCSATRTRSSSTSRPTASTPRASAGSATCSSTSPGRARRCS